ncbi:glutamyl-tRNA amidotransferase [Paraburkholderia bengalensis]|uniref:Glutamyl-tRNA amidotransferase n=2 Tax=Paraburkholderia bengalensis TaxID=2747562 RepID=A0ABU8J652_9BURK
MTESRNRNVSTMRRDKRFQPRTTDSYRSPVREQGGTSCRECGAVYENGRWKWSASAEHTSQLVCPACRRILEHAPAGELWLESGEYLRTHHDEVASLLRHASADEEKLHVLERLMSIEDQPEGMRVTTTGPHTLRRLSEALVRAHHGHLTIEYRDAEGVLRARWRRD